MVSEKRLEPLIQRTGPEDLLRKVEKYFTSIPRRQIIKQAAEIALGMYRGKEYLTGIIPKEEREQFRRGYLQEFQFDLLAYKQDQEGYLNQKCLLD